MPEEWPGQAELHGQLKKLDGISSSKIAVIADIAVKAVKYYKFVVFAIEHHMKHGDGKARLQGMCIIDAVLRVANEQIPRDKNPYPSRFSKNIALTLGLAAACTANDRAKIVRIVKIWVSGKLLPENARREINEWLQKHDVGAEAGAAIREPTSRLLSSIDKLKEGRPAPDAEDPDTFDYGDEDDDEARLASQARRLEEQCRKLEAEKEVAASAAVKVDAKPGMVDAGAGNVAATASSGESELHRFGFVRHPDQSNVPTGMVRVLSCVLYIGGIASGFQADQLRVQIGTFGKIDDIRIVNGAVANSAFVRYIDREEAESAKNLVRSYCPEYKIGWGKGVGVSKDDFDTRQGIGMVPEAALSRTTKPVLPARPAIMPEPQQAPAHSAPAAAAIRHQAAHPAPSSSASWSAAAPIRPPPQAIPPYGSAAPPRSIGAVPAAWDGGVKAAAPWGSPLKPQQPPSSRAPPPAQSGWGSQPTVAASSGAGAWGDSPAPPLDARSAPSSSWDQKPSPAPGSDRGARSESSWDAVPPPRGANPSLSSSFDNGRPSSSFDNGRSSSSFDNGRPSSSFDKGRPSSSFDNGTPSSSFDKGRPSSSFDQGRLPSSFVNGRPSSSFDKGTSSSFDKGRSSSFDRGGLPSRDQRGPPSSSFDKRASSWSAGPAAASPSGSSFSGRPAPAPSSTGGGAWDNNPSSGLSRGDPSPASDRGSSVQASSGSWGDVTPSSGPAWGDTGPPARGNTASSGASSFGVGNDAGQVRTGNGSSWGGPAKNDHRRSDSGFDAGPARGGGGGRFNDLDGGAGRSSDRDGGGRFNDKDGGRFNGRDGGGGGRFNDRDGGGGGRFTDRDGGGGGRFDDRDGGGSRFNDRGGGGGRFNDRNGGGDRLNDRDRSSSRPFCGRDSNRDEKEFDSSRGTSRSRDDHIRGAPKSDWDAGAGSGNDGGRGGRGGRGRCGGRGGGRGGGGRGGGRANSDGGSSSWGNGTNWGGGGGGSDFAAKSDAPAAAANQPNSSWGDQPSSGAAWGSTPSAGASWDAKPAEVSTSSEPAAGDQVSGKRDRVDAGGWGSLPADDGEKKKSRLGGGGWSPG